MEWWRLLLADGCPDAGEPLPHCLGDRTGEHDMAEAGELAHAIHGEGRHETLEYLCRCA